VKPYSHLKPRRTMNPPVRHLKTLYSSRTVKRHAENDGISVLLNHHTRKGRADGVIESIAGTGGISAAADTIWRLKRKPEGQAVLEVLGREVEEFVPVPVTGSMLPFRLRVALVVTLPLPSNVSVPTPTSGPAMEGGAISNPVAVCTKVPTRPKRRTFWNTGDAVGSRGAYVLGQH
jgi:hypothetical protein